MENRILKILDIDLDFFLNDVYHGPVTSETRLSDEEYTPWPENEVVKFLEHNCGLSNEKPIRGSFFKHHVEAFYLMRELQEKNDFNYRFRIDHVDAHGDLGTGDASYKYIASDILARPLRERAYPDLINGWEGLSSGNFLAFAIACQWVEELTYVNVADADDCQLFNLVNYKDPNDGIQLRQFSPAKMKEIIYSSGMHEYSHTQTPLSIEPLVPFTVLDHAGFQSDDAYDHIWLTHSPGFTPPKADGLIPIIMKYMELVKP